MLKVLPSASGEPFISFTGIYPYYNTKVLNQIKCLFSTREHTHKSLSTHLVIYLENDKGANKI